MIRSPSSCAVASAGLAEPPPIEEDIARLTEDAARLERVPPTQRRARHLELADDARRIEAMLDHRFAREVEHRVVIGPTEHAAILAELVDSARTQIVIAVPWVRYAALRTVEPRLRQAVKRGVQVVVVWGIAHRSTLDVQVDSAIDSLTRERGRASALVPKVSARTHAKVVVCDDRRALVTSWNALSARGGDHEIGLLLSSPTTGAVRRCAICSAGSGPPCQRGRSAGWYSSRNTSFPAQHRPHRAPADHAGADAAARREHG